MNVMDRPKEKCETGKPTSLLNADDGQDRLRRILREGGFLPWLKDSTGEEE